MKRIVIFLLVVFSYVYSQDGITSLGGIELLTSEYQLRKVFPLMELEKNTGTMKIYHVKVNKIEYGIGLYKFDDGSFYTGSINQIQKGTNYTDWDEKVKEYSDQFQRFPIIHEKTREYQGSSAIWNHVINQRITTKLVVMIYEPNKVLSTSLSWEQLTNPFFEND